jgi:hypothetical protein
VTAELRAELAGLSAGGQDDHGRGGQGEQLVGDPEPRRSRGADVDDRHVRPQHPGRCHRPAINADVTDHVESLGTKQRPVRAPRDLVIVDEQDPGRAGAAGNVVSGHAATIPARRHRSHQRNRRSR